MKHKKCVKRLLVLFAAVLLPGLIWANDSKNRGNEENEKKAYEYRIKAEKALLTDHNLKEFDKNIVLCEKLSPSQGAEARFFSAGFYFDVASKIIMSETKNTMQQRKCISYLNHSKNDFKKAFADDPEFHSITANDITTYTQLCRLTEDQKSLSDFWEAYRKVLEKRGVGEE